MSQETPLKQTKAQRRRAQQRALKASPRAEARYVSDLAKILRGVRDWLEGEIKPHLDALGPDRRHDASKHAVRAYAVHATEKVVAGIKVHVAKHVGESFDRMAGEINKRNLAGMKLLGVTPRAMGAEDILRRARDANIGLVEKAGRSYAADVRAIFEDDANFGVDVGELASKLWDRMKERGDVSESRARLIARDQTLKTCAALTRDRAEKAGYTRYTWSTVSDDRVRPMHADLDDTPHSWDEPPITSPDGERNHPGEDYQCRCVPIFSLSDEGEPE